MPDTAFSENTTEETVETTEVVETTNETTEETHWYTGGDEYKDLASKFETPEAMAKELTNAQSLIGKKGLIKPGDDATDEEIESYHRELGKPETSDGYELTDVDPDGELPKEWLESSTATFRALALAADLSQEQADKQFQAFMAYEKTQMVEQAERVAEANRICHETLKTEYGADSGRVLAEAQAVAKEYGVISELAESPLGNSAAMVKMMSDFAKSKGLAVTAPAINTDLSTGQTINDKIAEIRANADYGKSTKEGLTLNDKIMELYTKKAQGLK